MKRLYILEKELNLLKKEQQRGKKRFAPPPQPQPFGLTGGVGTPLPRRQRARLQDASLDIHPLSVRKFKILFLRTLSK